MVIKKPASQFDATTYATQTNTPAYYSIYYVLAWCHVCEYVFKFCVVIRICTSCTYSEI